jgi:hypothetical protein
LRSCSSKNKLLIQLFKIRKKWEQIVKYENFTLVRVDRFETERCHKR